MAYLPKMAFSPVNGLRDTVAYPAEPESEEAAREQVQGRMDEIKNYLNNTLTTEVDNLISTKVSKFIGTTTGTGTALAVTITGATLDDFTNIQVRLHTDIGDNPTLNLNSLGAKPIYTPIGNQVKSGAVAGTMMNLSYNSSLGRWYLLDAYGGGIDTTVKDVWQTWVKLAGLIPSDYANLAAVVASSTAMTALGNSGGAVDYMIDSTNTIMPAVVGSVNAMTKVGLSSYAINKIVDNTTWITAISASANAYTGLKASSPIGVPTMTNDTTPSGYTASQRTTYSGRSAYMAFDNNTSTEAQQTNTTDSWLQIQMPSPVWLFGFYAKFAAVGILYQFDNIGYSDDGTNFTFDSMVLSDGSVQTMEKQCPPIVGRHKYWRFRATGRSTAMDIYDLTLYFK